MAHPFRGGLYFYLKLSFFPLAFSKKYCIIKLDKKGIIYSFIDIIIETGGLII